VRPLTCRPWRLVLASAAHLLSLSDLGLDELAARRVAEEAVADGSALSAYERWIEAQGGDPGLDSLPRAPVVREVTAPADGFVRRLGAIAIGHAALHLGAGRRTKEDPMMVPSINKLPNMILNGGGVVITINGEVIGAIGAAGAPGGELDEACAKAGLDKILSRLTP